MREIRIVFENQRRHIGTIYYEDQVPYDIDIAYKVMACIGDFLARQKTYVRLVKAIVIEDDGTETEWKFGGKKI